jgi:DNA-binding winged helix-turn-helix (wHTH) protein/TolB-like protein/Tfp pilus assembly protein PilF
MSNQQYEFDEYTFDAIKQVLTHKGEVVRLKAKACELLKVLLEHRGEVLDKDRLMSLLWPDTVVEENNLTVHMTALRKALGESPNERRFIMTIPGRGYRFVAEVKEFGMSPAVSEVIFAEQMRTSVTFEEVAEDFPDYKTKNQSENLTGKERKALPALSAKSFWSFKMIAALSLVAILLALASYVWRTKQKSVATKTPIATKIEPPAIKSLAVLPFKSLTPQKGGEYYSVGLADIMITRLSNLRELTVRPTGSVLAFASQDPLQAGQALKVDSVLDGTIQQQGDRVRVTVRLLRVSDGQSLWAFQCDEKCTNIFALQDTISGKITEALALNLSGSERERLMKSYTANAQAYESYLKGRFYALQYTPEGFKKAIENLNAAITADPTYALAYAGLADAYTAASEWLLPPREALSKAKAAAQKALSLDDTLAEAHAALGHAQMHHLEPTAESELQRALELNPNSVTVMLWYGEYFMGKDLPKGLAILRHAQQIDPLSPVISSFISSSYFFARQSEEALAEAQKALAIAPDDIFARGMLALAYDLKGNYAEAIAEGEKVRQTARTPQPLGTLGRSYALAKKPEKARQIIAELQQMSKQQYISPYDIAVVYTALGEKDEAFKLLEKAREDGTEWMGWVGVDYRLEALHSDPRFDDFLRRVGLLQQ